jgi:hypothetical protein
MKRLRMKALLLLIIGWVVLGTGPAPETVHAASPDATIIAAAVRGTGGPSICEECGVCWSGDLCPSEAEQHSWCGSVCGGGYVACWACDMINPEVPQIECYEDPPPGQTWQAYWYCRLPS